MEKIVDGYILNSGNREILKKAIHKYLMEVLKEEEYLNTLEKCYADAYRVKVQGVKKLTPSLVKAWLQGLPLCTEYRTWSILVMMFKWLGLSETEAKKEGPHWGPGCRKGPVFRRVCGRWRPQKRCFPWEPG